MAGAFGTSLIFLLLLAATAILGGMLLVSASHSFLVVVVGTAAGNDAVEWPDEPYFDWLGRALLLLWLTAFWLVPVGIAAKVLAPVFLPDDPLLRVALPAVPLFWLLFPVSVLSSLSASSRWVFFSPALVPRLLRCFGSLLAFYLITALLVAGVAGLVYLSLFQMYLVPVAAVAWAAGLLIYGRLLGRLGWLVARVKMPERGTAPKPPKEIRKATRRAAVSDPWAAPDKEPGPRKKKEPRAKPSAEGYGLAREDAPPAEPEKKTRPRVKGYGLSKEESPRSPVEPPLDGYLPVGRDALPPDDPEDDDDEIPPDRHRPISSQPPPPPPAYPLLSGVWSFPWYATSRKAWFFLSLGGLVILCLIQAMYAYLPR